jgi:hypothetical protein
MSSPSGSNVSYQVVRLERGSHNRPEDGVCVMELASMLAGESFSDQPECVCRVIGPVLRAYNDLMDDDRRQDLFHYASLVVGSRDSEEIEWRRADHCLSWADQRRRECGPLFRLLHRWGRALRDDPRSVYMHRLTPLFRNADDRRHAQVLELVDELLEIRSGGGQLRPLLPQRPLAPTSYA